MFNLSKIRQVNFHQAASEEAILYVYEEKTHIPFPIKRTFVIKTTRKCERGFHAHKECSQLFVILNGECNINCDDGEGRKDFLLNNPGQGLLIPPTIWAKQSYEKDTILMVLTDRLYDEIDYIRNYEDFLKFRGVK